MPRRKDLPEPIAKLRNERKWPEGVPMPKAGSYRSGQSWSGEDEDVVRKYYSRYGARYCARLLGRTPNAVKTYAGLIGVVGEKAPNWKAAELELLKKLYGRVPPAELSRRFGRPEIRVRDKARQLGLTKAPKTLTKQMVVRIVRDMGRVPLFDVARELGISLKRTCEIARANGYEAPGSRPRRPWQTSEDDFLKKNRLTMSLVEMAEALGRSRSMVEARAMMLGLKLDHSQPQVRVWTKREDDLLRKLSGTLSRDEIAARLGRAAPAVRVRARALGLKIGNRAPRRFWTPREDALLRKLAPTVERREIARRLGRELSTLEQRAKAIGVKLLWSGPEHWTAEEDAKLRRLARRYGPTEIADRMGYSVSAVGHRFTRLGLSKPRTTAYRDWTAKEDKLLMKLFGKVPRKQIAEQLGRSVYSVALRAARLKRKAANDSNRTA